jgi:hypothetical protein
VRNLEVGGCDARSPDAFGVAPVRQVVSDGLTSRSVLKHGVVFGPVEKMTNGRIATIQIAKGLTNEDDTVGVRIWQWI